MVRAASAPLCAALTVIATPPVYVGACHVTRNELPTVPSTAGTEGTPGNPSGAGSLGLLGSVGEAGPSLTHPDAGQLTRVAESPSVDIAPPAFPPPPWKVHSEHTRITSVCTHRR